MDHRKVSSGSSEDKTLHNLKYSSQEIEPLKSKATKSVDYSESQNSVRFERRQMLDLLNSYVRAMNQMPIEKIELDLFKVTEIFQNRLYGKTNPIKCIEKVHHILKLNNEESGINSKKRKEINKKIEEIIQEFPTITIEYEVFTKVLSIWSALIVKWGIFKNNNYDYRCNGRGLNVRMLNLIEMNKSILSIDVIWISTMLLSPSLREISSSLLTELGTILHYQIKQTIHVFLTLNPKIIDPKYNIENTLAYSSREFQQYYKEALPEENLCNFSHKSLRFSRGFERCFRSTDPAIEEAFMYLQELDLIYRNFEKLLITNILKACGNAEFE